MKTISLAVTLFLLFSISLFSQESIATIEQVRGITARKAVALANEWAVTAPSVKSIITTEEVVFSFPSGNKTAVPLPPDEVMIAVAPYVHNTHECAVHNITSCQGELVDLPVNVVVTSQSGTSVVNETFRTMRNGFIELWLPKGEIFDISLSMAGREAHGRITTFPGSNTCLTVFKLK